MQSTSLLIRTIRGDTVEDQKLYELTYNDEWSCNSMGALETITTKAYALVKDLAVRSQGVEEKYQKLSGDEKETFGLFFSALHLSHLKPEEGMLAAETILHYALHNAYGSGVFMYQRYLKRHREVQIR